MLIDNLREAREKDNLAPAIEQLYLRFLDALRLGIRPGWTAEGCRLLAGYLSKLISRWVEPRASKCFVECHCRYGPEADDP